MKKLLKKLRATAERWRTRCFEALGFTPSAELYALSEAYNDELRERLMHKVHCACCGRSRDGYSYRVRTRKAAEDGRKASAKNKV